VRVIREDRKRFDAILLDVDNGPRALTTETNSWLYSPAGLRGIMAALRPRGILAIWSSGPDDAFVRRLQQTGFAVEQVAARSKGNKGPRYIIWIAQLAE
jgi:spermidine synthase